MHPLGGEESHFYWAEEGAARVRRMTTKKVVSISGNNRMHHQQTSWLRRCLHPTRLITPTTEEGKTIHAPETQKNKTGNSP